MVVINWNYTNYLSCDSTDALYKFICGSCDELYRGQKQDLKERTKKCKSDI